MKVKMPFSRNPKVRQMMRELNKKDAEIKQLKRHLKRTFSQSSNPNEPVSTPQRKATTILQEMNVTPTSERVKSVLPLTVAVDAVKTAEPKVKKLLFSRRPKVKRMATAVSSTIHIHRKYLFKSRKQSSMRRSIAISKKVLVCEFLKRADNSYELPGKKDSVRYKGRYALTDTLVHLYAKFQSENPTVKLSLSSFCKCRPPYITLIRFTNRRQCLCQKCAKLCLALKVAPTLPKSPQALLDLTDADIEEKLLQISNTSVKYQQWQRCPVDFKGKTIFKIKFVDLEKSTQNFAADFKAGLKDQREHSFRIAKQYEEIRRVKQRLEPLIEVCLQMDYSENWAAQYPDEIVAVYYDKAQITIHPMIMHYRSEDGLLKHKSYVGVTREGSHTVPTTYAFLCKVMTAVKEEMPDIDTVHFISDGPSSQYRNRTVGTLVARSLAKWGVKSTWTYLETGHGKGPCDGVGGSLKKKMDNLVKHGEAVRSSAEFCAAVISEEMRMTVVHLTPEEVARKKKMISRWEIKPIPGLMRSHALVPKGGFLYTRAVSCFDACCYTRDKSFALACQGWQKTKVEIQDDSENESDNSESSMEIESDDSENDKHNSSHSDIEIGDDGSENDEGNRSDSNMDIWYDDLVNDDGNSSDNNDEFGDDKKEQDGSCEMKSTTEYDKSEREDDYSRVRNEKMGDDKSEKDKENMSESNSKNGDDKLEKEQNVSCENKCATEDDKSERDKDNSTDSTKCNTQDYRESDDCEDDIPLKKLKEQAQTNIGKITEAGSCDMSDMSIGDYLGVQYGKKWYAGKVLKVKGQNLTVSFMKPWRGKWKWGQRDTGTVSTNDILGRLPVPVSEGSLLTFPSNVIEEMERRFSLK